MIVRHPARLDFSHLLTYEEVDALSTDEIIKKLHDLGIPFKQESFLKDIETYYSAQDLSESWWQQFAVTATGREEDFPWFAAWILWERLAPAENLSTEQISDLIDTGYSLADKNNSRAACDVWLEAWEAIKRRIEPTLRDLRELNKRYQGSFFVSNFCQDLEIELQHAGLRDSVYFEKRITYCREFLHHLPEGSELILHNMGRALAESYAWLDQYKEAELEFEKLLRQFPDNPWGYIGWGDIFFTEGKRRDYARAQQLYEKALEIAIDKGDIETVKERMEGLQKEYEE